MVARPILPEITRLRREIDEALWDDGAERAALTERGMEEIEKLRIHIAELKAALKPFAKTWLFPDDLGEEASATIRSDPDWNEEANDKAKEDVMVSRGDIRAARAALSCELARLEMLQSYGETWDHDY